MTSSKGNVRGTGTTPCRCYMVPWRYAAMCITPTTPHATSQYIFLLPVVIARHAFPLKYLVASKMNPKCANDSDFSGNKPYATPCADSSPLARWPVRNMHAVGIRYFGISLRGINISLGDQFTT